MKTKMKGKAIIGIAMAAIMLASVFAAMVPTGTAQVDPAVGRVIESGGLIIIGETNVSFNDTINPPGITAPVTIKGPTDDIGTTGKNTIIISEATGYVDTEGQGLVAAEYSVMSGATVLYTVTFANPTFTLETRKIDSTGAITGDKVSSCVKNEKIGFVLTSNLEAIDLNGIPHGITYKVTDAIGVSRDQKANLDGSGNNQFPFTGTDKVGEYRVKVETNDSVCNGLDTTSSEIKFTVTELGISISADKDRIAKGKEVPLTGTTSPKTLIWINVTSGTKGDVLFKGGKGQYTGADYTPTTTVPGVSITTKSDGTYTVVAQINATGTYEFEARVAGTTTYKKGTVEVTDIVAEITTDKTSYAAGEDMEITGTSSAGTYAIIAFDEKVVASETIKSDNTFSFTLSGVNKAGGSYKIEAFIYPTTVKNPIPPVLEGTSTSDLKNKDGDSATADASTAVLLITGELTASISTKKTAFGDDFTVSGEAPGMKDVTVLVVAPRGTDAKGIGDKYPGNSGLSLKVASVSSVDYTFSLKRDVPKTDIDTGKYMVIVIAPGRDGDYGRAGTYDSVDAAITGMAYSIGSKTQEQFLAIVNDMCSPTLSDDTVWVEYTWLEAGFVKLDTIEGVASGETLTITGTTNRKDNYPIMVTVEGPTTLEPATAKAEGGKFTANFTTSGADPGTYTVTADDGDGHTSILPVTDLIKPAGEVPEVSPTPTAAPTATPTTTAAPTTAPTAEPTAEPTPTPTPPGFEAVFAIAGMLAIAYLVLRRRK